MYGIAAAASFGVSAPLAKTLLTDTHPVMLAGILYLGAAAALAVAGYVRRSARAASEAPLQRGDVPALLGVAISGGVLGPILMLYGLQHVSGLTGALWLNLEAPLTMIVAVALFGEHLDRREIAPAVLILLGGLALGLDGGTLGGNAIGALALSGACLSWALDNNLTQRLSIRDPIAIVRVKALVAATTNLSIAFVAGAPLPSGAVLAAGLVLGAVSYGLSIVLDTYALRYVGAAREAAYFSTAPFFGGAVAVIVLGDRLGLREGAAGLAMALGVIGLLRARHGHLHDHGVLAHEHAHTHDEHHQHGHEGLGLEDREPHTHLHSHTPLHHGHPHVSDEHHRHRH